MTQEQKIIGAKVGLLELAKQLGNVSQACKMMGGSIEVTSEPGRGSTFRFTARFDRQNPQEDQTDHSPFGEALERSAPRSTGRVRVLLAEDNTINLEVARGMLENFGCEVDGASNGQETLEHHAVGIYDLIFMDCQMPDMDGFQATAEIRRREARTGQHLPIVALTASAIEGDREQCLAAGMDDYVTKPFTTEQMYSALVKWMQVTSPA